MSSLLDAFTAGLRVAAALDRHRSPHALGGALAYGQYGVPRATNNVDANVFVEPTGYSGVFDALRSLEIEVDEAVARREAEDEGRMSFRLGGLRVDVYTPSIDFSWDAQRTRVQYDVEGTPVWFLSAEALCVFKLLYFRRKDIVDLERLAAVQGPALDADDVRARIVAMLGDDDPRVEAWDRLWRDHGRGGQ